jgi:kynurenine formamidase
MKLIDISHVLDENTPIYPGDYETKLSIYKSIEKDNYNAYLLQTCLHTGTHIDMPMHFIDDNKTAVDYPLNNFFGNGVLLDARGETNISMKPVYKEMINEHDIVLLFTGHDIFWGKDEYFTRHPVVSDDLAEYLLTKNIKILGMDMPAPDYHPFMLHKNLLGKKIFILENLTNLQDLISIRYFKVMALPLKINAEASFVRAVCII